MKIITLSVTQARAFLADLDKALEPVALQQAVVSAELNDRDARTLAEVLREQVLISEEARLAAGRKAKESV